MNYKASSSYKRFQQKKMGVVQASGMNRGYATDSKMTSSEADQPVTKMKTAKKHYSKGAIMLAMADHGDRHSGTTPRHGMNHG